MERKSIIVIAFLALSVVVFLYINTHGTMYSDAPKDLPTWGWTKIANVTIEKNYTISDIPFREVTSINLTIDAKKSTENKTQATYLYSSNSLIAEINMITSVQDNTAVVTKMYSDTRTQFTLTSTVVVEIPINTALSVTIISSKNSYTYYGTYEGNIVTYTYTYAGNDTWIGYYSTVVDYSGTQITGIYTATIIQK